MTMTRLPLLACLAMCSLAGCATTADPQTQAKNDNQVCEQVATLGSNITRRQCYTAEQRAEQRRTVEELERARGASQMKGLGQ